LIAHYVYKIRIVPFPLTCQIGILDIQFHAWSLNIRISLRPMCCWVKCQYTHLRGHILRRLLHVN